MRRHSSTIYESSIERVASDRAPIKLQKSEKFKKKHMDSFYENISSFPQQIRNQQKDLRKQLTLYDSQCKFNGPINIFSQFQFEMTQVSQVGSYKNRSEVPSFYETQLSSKIQDLQTQLEKKSGLVKYLERKCGQHILKTTKKYQDRIVELQTEIKVLKKTVQYLSKTDSKCRVLGCIQRSNEFSFSQIQPLKLSKKGFISQDLFKLTESELIEIILAQSQQIQKFYKKSQIFQSNTNSIRKLSKQKKASFSASKKHPTFFSNIDLSIRKSNENLNQLNLVSVLKDTQNLNNSIKSQDSNRKEPPIQSFRPVLQYIQTQIQTDDLPIISLSQFNLQTQESMKDIQNFELNIIDYGIQIDVLKKQIEVLKDKNKKLSQQMQFYNEKLQNYCQQLNQKIFDPNAIQQVQIFEASVQSPIQIDQTVKTSIQIPQNPQIIQSSQFVLPKPTYIQQNYFQILHIFGIQIKQPLYMHQEHQILIHQICGMKKQISKLLKQFKKLQKQLNQAFNHNNWLSDNLKCEQDRTNKLQDYIRQILVILQNVNEQIMELKNRQLNNKLMKKYSQYVQIEEKQQLLKQNIQLNTQYTRYAYKQSNSDQKAIKLSKIKLENKPTCQQSQKQQQQQEKEEEEEQQKQGKDEEVGANSPIMIMIQPDEENPVYLSQGTQVLKNKENQQTILKANLEKYLSQFQLIQMEEIQQTDEQTGDVKVQGTV